MLLLLLPKLKTPPKRVEPGSATTFSVSPFLPQAIGRNISFSKMSSGAADTEVAISSVSITYFVPLVTNIHHLTL